GLAGVARAADALKRPHRTGAQRVALLRELQSLASTSAVRIASLDLGPSTGLIGPVARGHAEVAQRLQQLRDTLSTVVATTGAAADLLEGPRRYLVFGANNSEMRSGSGMFLTIAELATRGGGLALGG